MKKLKFYATGNLFLVYLAFFGLPFRTPGSFSGILNIPGLDVLGVIKAFSHLTSLLGVVGVVKLVNRRMRMMARVNEFLEKKTASHVFSFYYLLIQIFPAFLFPNIHYSWLSDLIMNNFGYLLLAVVGIVTLFLGVVYITFGFIFNGKFNIRNYVMGLFLMYLYFIAFVGLYKFSGFLGEFGVSSFSEYVSLYGFRSLILEGPVKRFNHLLAIPSFLGTVALSIRLLPKLVRRLGYHMSSSRSIMPEFLGKFANEGLAASSFISLIFIAIQIIPAVIFGISATYLSDLLLNDMGGYLVIAFFGFMGFLGGILTSLFL